MFVQLRSDGGQRLVTSASDLTAASMCEFAFLRRVDSRLGRDVIVPDDDDPMLKRAAVLGDAYEARVLADYVVEFGKASAGLPGGVVQIAREYPPSAEALREAQDRTVAALRVGADVVFQATFFDPSQVESLDGGPEIGFVGYADFLQLVNDADTDHGQPVYEVQDTKLARRARVTALMQLAAYAEQLERLGVAVSPEAVLILGDGSHSRHKLRDVAPVFRSRRARLHELLLERARATGADGLQASAEAVAWGSDSIATCGRCEVCAAEVERARDPLMIAGIRISQRDALMAAGYDTIEKVAGVTAESIEGLTTPILERIRQQAALQVGAMPDTPPPFRVIDPAALGAIPQPNVGDLFFDFEGDPMFQAEGRGGTVRWGLDYLFGMVDIHENFTAIWAHDLTAEREALERFLALVAERRQKYPAMRIYHYASYERTHLLSIAARHGVGEAEVDQLLREHVLVDLYPIVRHALRVGSRSYSIKKLEPLYMGEHTRDDDEVTNAAQSVTEYADATALLASNDEGERSDGQRRLDDIATYNKYDCVSTLRLRDWLLRLAAEHNVQPVPPVSAERDGDTFEVDTIATSLAWYASTAQDEEDRRAAALAGSAIDYYQREQKSFWWEHFARLVEPIEEWADTRDVMVVDGATSEVVESWFTPERARVERRHIRLRGAIAPGSNLKVDSEAYLLYEYPAPFSQAGEQPGARGAKQAKIIAVYDDGVTVEELLTRGVGSYDELPVALTPGPPPRAGRQRGAIQEWGRRLADSLSRGVPMPDPVYDIMRRRPPRLIGATELVAADSDEALAAVGGEEDSRAIGAVISTLRRLDRSTLAVQGPPGTGKTYLAAKAIRTLVERDGWHIGVVAQSHRVVENVLDGVVAAGLDPTQVGKVPQGGKLSPGAPDPSFTVIPKDQHSLFLNRHRQAGRGAVIGGTAWDFSHEGRLARHSLDLLVIDEAGQFSLAPTIAASVAAERLLLLGDPQQLPQVSQGSHPEPVDTSALSWLLGEHETMPESLGYFLEETRRMRPELADVVSELAYEGRLTAHPDAAQREVTDAGPAGLVWHPIEHRGNSTSSTQEAAEVARIARQALEGTLREEGRAPRGLAQADLIVVAAYNAQVETVSRAMEVAGLAEVRVGTVDKFQGQEASIAIVTLAASSIEDIPRGVEFLLMRNRLNVAISRAQWAAHLVSSTRLGDGLPGSAEGVAALSGYLRLTERGAATAPHRTAPH